jgi:hypothetical protein
MLWGSGRCQAPFFPFGVEFFYGKRYGFMVFYKKLVYTMYEFY